MPATLPPDVRQRPHTPLGGKLSRNIDLLEACLQEKRPRKPLLACSWSLAWKNPGVCPLQG
jgi:hypothetical protein